MSGESRGLDDLLALADCLADGSWQSGERLAAGAGISRAALAKRIERLREQGLEVEARHGLGYRLAQPLQRLDPARLSAVLPQLSVRVLPVTDSTNRVLTESPSDADPQAVFAERQTAGRGRRGRVWQSPFGANLYLSLAWCFATWPPRLSTLPLAIGVGCCRALADAGLDDVGLKWPNDLIRDGRKLGGILIEQRGESGDSCRVIVGIGLNVAMSSTQASGVDQPWTSVHASQQAQGLAPTPRPQLAEWLLLRQVETLARFAEDGFAPFADAFAARDLLRDRPVRVSGATVYEGIARGIDADGALLVEHQGRIDPLHAGDVSLRVL